MTRSRSQADTNVMDAGQTPTLDSSRRSQGSSASSYSPSVLSSNGEDDLSGSGPIPITRDHVPRSGLATTLKRAPIGPTWRTAEHEQPSAGPSASTSRPVSRPHPHQSSSTSPSRPKSVIVLHSSHRSTSRQPSTQDPSSVRWQALRDARR
jgi:hypothetical protein